MMEKSRIWFLVLIGVVFFVSHAVSTESMVIAENGSRNIVEESTPIVINFEDFIYEKGDMAEARESASGRQQAECFVRIAFR
ncbi:MAG: hypothetical protein ABIJ27_04100 [Candidatus Omnitrophota bacterium]